MVAHSDHGAERWANDHRTRRLENSYNALGNSYNALVEEIIASYEAVASAPPGEESKRTAVNEIMRLRRLV